MVRPRLLFLGPTVPFPPDRDLAHRSYNILRTLARHYEVDGLFFAPRTDPTQMPLERRIAHLKELGEIETFPLPAERSPLRAAWDRLRGPLTGRSPEYWRFDSAAYRRRVLERIFERDPAIIHVDGLGLHLTLGALQGRTIVLNHHHVDSRRLRERAEHAPGGERGALRREAERAEALERRWLPRVALNVTAIPADLEALSALVPEAMTRLVPLGVDTRHFTPGPGTGHGLAFVGGTREPANRDALQYFATEILPRLRRAIGLQALEPISWVGTIAEGDRPRYRELGIDLTGYVEDIRPIVRPAACYIVPARFGSSRGTRILQAWAMARAVVSTSVGCAGLPVKDGENILVRDDAASFADAVAQLLSNRDLRMRLGAAGRRTVEAHHDWSAIGADLLRLYREVENSGAIHGRGAGEELLR